MAQVRRNFQQCGKVETFPWARVQPIGTGVQLPLGVGRQIHALWQGLAPQPGGILVSATGQDLQGGIDRFGREPFPHLVRIRVSSPPGNLFRRAARVQVGLTVRPAPGIQECAGASRLTSSGGCLGLSGAGPIRSARCDVASHLAAHGAGHSPQDASMDTEGVALDQPKTQGLTFFDTQMTALKLDPRFPGSDEARTILREL